MENTKNLWLIIYKNVRKKHPDWSHKRVYLAARAILEKREKAIAKAPAEA